METLAKCRSCGYRHVDVLVPGEKNPVRCTIKIEVSELGVTITPGPDAEGYVSNVEGVLKRIEGNSTTISKKALKDRIERNKFYMEETSSLDTTSGVKDNGVREW